MFAIKTVSLYKDILKAKSKNLFFVDYLISCSFDNNIWSSCFALCICFDEKIVSLISLKKTFVYIYKHPQKLVQAKKFRLANPRTYTRAKSKKVSYAKSCPHENLSP